MNPNKSNTFNSNVYDRPISATSQFSSQSSMVKPLLLPCKSHHQQYCQNYCIQPKCFQVLCSQCIQQHLLHHKKSGLNDLAVKSFRGVRVDCTNKLHKIIQKLLQKISMLQQPKNSEQMIDQVQQKLEHIRVHMHQTIDQQFVKIREAIKAKVAQSFTTVKQLNQIHENLSKIIAQLKQHSTIICQGIVDHSVSVTDSIEKTISLNENTLYEMFEREGSNYEHKMRRIDVQISYDQNLFRNSLLQSLKLTQAKNLNSRIQDKSRSRSRSPINNSSLFKQKRQTTQQQPNYKILHYFQTGTNHLHLIDLKKGQANVTKKIIKLDNFSVPIFHATILSQTTGAILIGGGTSETLQGKGVKSKILSKYSLKTNQFKRQFSQVKPRSSHSMCQDTKHQIVYILGGYGQQSIGQNDQSLASFQTTVQRVNLSNGAIQYYPNSNWGGTNIAVFVNGLIIKACSEGIQVLNTKTNNREWAIVNLITNYEWFAKGLGYTMISEEALILYGGYNDQQDQSAKDDCHVMRFFYSGNSAQTIVKTEVQKLNVKLPIASGFWNNPGLLSKGFIYCIQNVQDEDGQQLIESDRTLLRYSIGQKNWKIVQHNS